MRAEESGGGEPRKEVIDSEEPETAKENGMRQFEVEEGEEAINASLDDDEDAGLSLTAASDTAATERQVMKWFFTLTKSG